MTRPRARSGCLVVVAEWTDTLMGGGGGGGGGGLDGFMREIGDLMVEIVHIFYIGKTL